MLAAGVVILVSPDVSEELERYGFPKGVTSASAFGSSVGLAVSSYAGFRNADACERLAETIAAEVPEDVLVAFRTKQVGVAEDLSGGE